MGHKLTFCTRTFVRGQKVAQRGKVEKTSRSQVSQVSRGRIPGSENAFSMVKMFLFTWIFQKYSFRHIRAKAQKREKETQNLHDLYRLHDLYHGECLVLLDTGTKAEPKQVPGTT